MKYILYFFVVPFFSFSQNLDIKLSNYLKNTIKTKKRDSFYVNLNSKKEINFSLSEMYETDINLCKFETPCKLLFQKFSTDKIQSVIAVQDEFSNFTYYLVVFNRENNRQISVISLASHFKDGNKSQIKTSKFLSKTRFAVYDKFFEKKSSNSICSCTKTYYKILQNGQIMKEKVKYFDIKCK